MAFNNDPAIPVTRRFAVVNAYSDDGIALPSRQTRNSAGYDLAAAADCICPPGEITLIPTGLKVYMPADEFLAIALRSSLPRKFGLVLANGLGIIDSDYVDNPDNEGHFMIQVLNISKEPVIISKGERLAQGIFMKYQVVTEEDTPLGERLGGWGSTDKKKDS